MTVHDDIYAPTIKMYKKPSLVDRRQTFYKRSVRAWCSCHDLTVGTCRALALGGIKLEPRV